jgi:hypothetical protein
MACGVEQAHHRGMSLRHLFFPTLLLTLPIACSSTSSNGIPTSQISAYYTFDVSDAPQSATNAGAVLSQGKSVDSNIQIATGDTLTWKTDTDPAVSLDWDNFAKDYGSNTKTTAGGTTVTISLTRTDGTSAPNSTAPIPAAIAFTAPMPMANVSYAGGSGSVTVSWSNHIGAQVRPFVYPCGSAAAGTGDAYVADSGSLVINASELTSTAPPASGQCVTIQIDRQITGTVDPAMDVADSSFLSTRHSFINVNVVP